MAKKIIIVDDEEDITSAINVRLKAEGYDTGEAYGGREALALIRSELPDLVILDVMMPDMDGFQVCRELKKDPKCKRIPIIIFTVRSREIDRKIGFEAGSNAYFTKPNDSQALFRKVEEILSN